MKRRIFIIILFFMLALQGCRDNDLVVIDAWARPADQGSNSAIYFEIDNPTNRPDTLINVSSDIAQSTEIHLSTMDDQGVMKMEHQEEVIIDSRTRVLFEPGGLHVMLLDLHTDLELGSIFPLYLNFEAAGNIQVNVTVKEP